MPFKPNFEGEIPTLGWIALDWITEYLSQPGIGIYKPLILTNEQAQFILDLYAIDQVARVRIINRAVLSRPRGWGKSPLLGAICLFEALGPAVFSGWDANGRPVGEPWFITKTPIVHLAGVSIMQTKNTWKPMLGMARSDNLHNTYALDIAEKGMVITLPDTDGEIAAITSSAKTAKGGTPVMTVLDQTEVWVQSNGGIAFADTLVGNADKGDGITIESPNAYIPGDGSVAEKTAKYYKLVKDGRARASGLLYDHREAPADTDIYDEDSLRAGIIHAYGDSADVNGGWVRIERQVEAFFNTAADLNTLIRDKLNQITAATSAWYTEQQIELISRPDIKVNKGDTIVLGFDGSKGVTVNTVKTFKDEDGNEVTKEIRRGGKKADATVLMGIRVSDGQAFTLGHWEAPDGKAGDDWVPPLNEINAAIETAHEDYKVIGFYADVNGWKDNVQNWNAKWGHTYKVKASGSSPTGWNTAAIGKVTESFLELEDAINAVEITFDGNPDMTRHFLNARRLKLRSGDSLQKPDDDYTAKVDAVYSLMLAHQAYLAATGKGAKIPEQELYAAYPVRLY